MGSTYRSDRIPVHGLTAIGRYRRNRSLAVDFDCRRSILTVDGRLREKEEEGEEEKAEKRETPALPWFPARSTERPMQGTIELGTEDESTSEVDTDGDGSSFESEHEMGPEEKRAARKEHKKKVKEEKREQRKNKKISKAEKKRRKKLAKAKCRR
ncbi:hypothetical protein BHE74_00034042 [Ensete ventricosum]|nr:hypothetical protein GW17_00053493 [Ensete ventricosum]RWW59045.1 hypothetical protein BHE74_00034042 [Ensete ventricosum]RZR82003.1 hypothetical protein BHM03_00008339 [Ensete ventricosum]